MGTSYSPCNCKAPPLVLDVAFNADGSAATANWDKTATVWDVASGRELVILNGHSDAVASVAWNQDGSRLATGSYDKTAKVWDARSGQELLALRDTPIKC